MSVRCMALVRGLVLVTILAGCVSVPERVSKPRSQAIYHWPPAGQPADTSLALLELGDVDWIRLDTLHIDHTEYGSVKLPPGNYCIEMGKLFGVSVLVDPRMWVEHTALGKIRVEADRVYRLAADRTTGPGYVVSFQLMDAVADSVVPIVDRPVDFHLTASIALGDTVMGSLDAGDSTRVDCSPYEAYGLDVEADMPVEITLESEGFDPYLLLVSPAGGFVPGEDAGNGGRRVRIRKRLEESGRWLVVVNSLRAGETGTYRLVVRAR